MNYRFSAAMFKCALCSHTIIQLQNCVASARSVLMSVLLYQTSNVVSDVLISHMYTPACACMDTCTHVHNV